MVTPSRSEVPPLARWERMILYLAGLVGLSLLAVAVWLTPDPSGFGTHRQLGLPPCTFLVWLGIPCPSCGGTTAFAHFVRGQWLSAMRANVAATVLAAMCVAGIPWSWACAWRGRYLGVRDIVLALIVAMFTLVVLAAGQWIGRIQGWCQ